MIRVNAASRLHFGLFALPADGVAHWPNAEGQAALPARRFGGVGLMIEQPDVQVSVKPANTWSATGPSSDRALALAQRFMASLSEREDRFEIVVERCTTEHTGLGTGTQLGLSVARAVTMLTGHGAWDAVELARRTARGLRSSIGIHGFQHGGILVEAGKTVDATVSPLVARHPFPDDWQVLLILPRGRQGTHGAEERDAFGELAQRERDLRRAEVLSRLTLLGLLPALLEQDLPAFGESLYEFNRRAGEWFLPWQGGIYASPAIEEHVAWLRRHGIRGVGQSSWGPAVFAIERAEVLQHVCQRLLDQGELHRDELLLCRPVNHGAVVH